MVFKNYVPGSCSLTTDKHCLIVVSPDFMGHFEMIENTGHNNEIVNASDLVQSQELRCSKNLIKDYKGVVQLK